MQVQDFDAVNVSPRSSLQISDIRRYIYGTVALTGQVRFYIATH